LLQWYSSFLTVLGTPAKGDRYSLGGGGISVLPLSYSSKQTDSTVPVSAGISSRRAIYWKTVIRIDVIARSDTDPAIDQAAGYGTAAVCIVGKPSYAFDLHLTGKHHPGLTEIVPQMKISGLQLFAPETGGCSAPSSG
jgi:hypothetical protein